MKTLREAGQPTYLTVVGRDARREIPLGVHHLGQGNELVVQRPQAAVGFRQLMSAVLPRIEPGKHRRMGLQAHVTDGDEIRVNGGLLGESLQVWRRVAIVARNGGVVSASGIEYDEDYVGSRGAGADRNLDPVAAEQRCVCRKSYSCDYGCYAQQPQNIPAESVVHISRNTTATSSPDHAG